MGWRFRKSIKILPGVRVNFGLRSSSISFGGKGFRTTYSSTGRVTRSVGIPGTGLSYVTTSGNNGHRNDGQYLNRSFSTHANPQQLPMHSFDEIPASEGINPIELEEQIRDIYKNADIEVDWKGILIADPHSNSSMEWQYYKVRAEKVLNGDIDTYYELIQDLNPLDDLLQYGSEFECGTDDPRMLFVHFHVNSDAVLNNAHSLQLNQYNTLLQDYVCACTIRVARDIFALLPLRHLIVNAEDRGMNILSVDFPKKQFVTLDFQNIDASDTITLFNHRMNFNTNSGFAPIVPLNE